MRAVALATARKQGIVNSEATARDRHGAKVGHPESQDKYSQRIVGGTENAGVLRVPAFSICKARASKQTAAVRIEHPQRNQSVADNRC